MTNELTIKDIELLLTGLKAIGIADNLSELFAISFATHQSKKDPAMKATLEELRKEFKRSRDGQDYAEEQLHIEILRGKLAQRKLEILREKPFEGMDSVNLNR